MKFQLLALLISAMSPLLAIEAPLQPPNGPGGSNYSYSAVSISGPFNDGPICPGPDCNKGLQYYIFQPAAPRPVGPLPLVLFLHGYSADDPAAYQQWIDHIVKKGYNVIWVDWDNNGTAGGDIVIGNEISAFRSAIARIQSDSSYVQAAVNAKGVINAAAVGHSAGAFTAFRVASLSWDNSNGIPPIRAISAINPGQGNLPNYDMSGIHPSMLAVVVVGSDETACERYAGAKLYDQLSMLPTLSKSFLEAWTDNHGYPGLSAAHNFPATLSPQFSLDDMDWNISYKLTVALLDCAFYALNCQTALTNTSKQTAMGFWSDSVPVTPLTHFVTDPKLTFPWPIGVGCSQ